jgi:hypothetical protein
MAIGTLAAVGIGLAGAGAIASSSSANSASKRAAETSSQNNAENTALARDIYGQNKATLDPFVQRGNQAGDQINAMLGLGGGQQTQQARPNALAQFQPYQSAANQWGIGDGAYQPYGSQTQPDLWNRAGSSAYPQLNALSFQQQPAAQPNGQQTAQGAADDAFDIFRNSTNYQFRLNEGMDAVNSGYAGAGVLQSGAAMRAINDYGQNMASNELANYMNALGGQQATGAGAASSLAGVGQNFAGTVINSNNQNAANQMNAQLATGGNNALGNAAGILGGSLFQYGMG